MLVLLAWIILQTLRDEAARQKVNERLEDTNEKYNALIETSTDGALLILGEDIMFANFVFLAMSGYTLNDMKTMKPGGMIIIVKDISGRERIEKESMDLLNELQSSLLQMNLPVATFVQEHISCDIDLAVLDAVRLMSRKNQDAIIVMRNHTQPVGIVTDTDLRNRVIAREFNYNNPVYEIMSSPIIRINEQSLLYEAILKIKNTEFPIWPLRIKWE